MLIKSLKIFSRVWLTLAILFIVFGHAMTWYYQGFSKLMEIMSPFNIWNIIMIFIVLSPGLGAIYWVDYLNKKNKKDL